MQKNQLDEYIKLAMEADLYGNYKSADKIDNLIKQAGGPAQTAWRRLMEMARHVGNEGARARRLTRQLERGPGFIDRFRRQPSYEEAMREVAGEGKISGHDPRVLSNLGIPVIDNIINALQPTYRQMMSKNQEFPTLAQELRQLIDHYPLEEIDKRYGERLGEIRNELISMRDAHVDFIERAIQLVRRKHNIQGNDTSAIREIRARIASDPELRGMLYDNSYTTDGMIESVVETGTISMASYAKNFGPWKRSMSPLATTLILSGPTAAFYLLSKDGPKTKSVPVKEDKITNVFDDNKVQKFNYINNEPEVNRTRKFDKINNELEANRKGTGLYDTPIEAIEKYINRKKSVGAIVPGVTTKEDLYNMAIIDLGEHIANNLIQYVIGTYGVDGDEKTSIIGF